MLQFLNFGNQLRKLADELTALAKQADADRMAPLLLDFERDNPNLSGLIRSAFTGTPAEVLDRLRAWPVGAELAQLLTPETVAAIQARLREEWTKPRGAEPRNKLLKG